MDKKIAIILGAILLISSCDDEERGSRVRVQITTPPTVVQPILTPSPTVTPQTRDVKIQVAIDSAADLRIVSGNNIQVGQAISERYSIRQKLATQRQVLATRLQEIQQSDPTALTAPQIEEAKLDLQAAELELKEFSASRRWTSTAYQQFPDLTEAEAKKGRLLEERYQLAQSRLKQLEGSYRSALSQGSRQKDLITKEIATIDRQIDKAGIARSPYAGTIKDIKLIEVPGKEITAEITIAVPDKPTKLQKTPLNTV